MNSLHTGWINCNVSRSLKPPEFLFRIQSLSSCSQKGLIEYHPCTCILIFSQESTGSYADFYGSFSLYFLYVSYPAFQISAPPAAAAKSLQSCPTLRHPIDGSHPAPPSLGFSRQEYWNGLPFASPQLPQESHIELLTSSFLFVNSLPFVMVQKVSPGRHLGECDAHLMDVLSFTDNSLVLCCSGSERVASCSFSRYTVV